MNFTQGQKYALLILAGRTRVPLGDLTIGGDERTVHRDVAEWLVAHELATEHDGGIALTEAGEAAARQTHTGWYERFGPGTQYFK